MKDKKEKHLPKKLRSQFSKEIKSLFEGNIENITLPSMNIPDIRIRCAWDQGAEASYIIYDQDLNSFYKKIQKSLENLASKKAKLFTNKIKKFNKNFNAICAEHNVNADNELDFIIDEFKIKSIFDLL